MKLILKQINLRLDRHSFQASQLNALQQSQYHANVAAQMQAAQQNVYSNALAQSLYNQQIPKTLKFGNVMSGVLGAQGQLLSQGIAGISPTMLGTWAHPLWEVHFRGIYSVYTVRLMNA